MLPEPTFSFTIPSIHDDTPLDCRLYNPPHPVLNLADSELPWNPRGAIIAHPYAPFGGSYDNPFVLTVAAEILNQGFVVGTFNFRYEIMSLWGNLSSLIDSSAVVLVLRKAERAGRPSQKYTITSPSRGSSYTTSKLYESLDLAYTRMEQ